MSSDSLRVLYISYDGLLDPLGQSQILPYLEYLCTSRIEFFLLTFEKGRGEKWRKECEALRARLAQKRIWWTHLRYHKTPKIPATLYDIFAGVIIGGIIAGRNKVHIIHARSYVPSLMALILKRFLKTQFVFDMRGFWAEERMEVGLWSDRSPLYRFVKFLEAKFLAEADHIVTLTYRAKLELEKRNTMVAPVTVIPTCVDLDTFHLQTSQPSDSPRPIVFVYSGSIGTWYLLGEMLEFYRRARRRFPDSRFLLLTRGDVAVVRQEMARRGVPAEWVIYESAEYREVPKWLTTAHVGLAFYRSGYSRMATCPTKVGEYLACGLPVVVNQGVGDLEDTVVGCRVGVVVPSFTEEAYDRAVHDLAALLKDPHLPARCRKVASERFSLRRGADDYRNVYEQLSRLAAGCAV